MPRACFFFFFSNMQALSDTGFHSRRAASELLSPILLAYSSTHPDIHHMSDMELEEIKIER